MAGRQSALGLPLHAHIRIPRLRGDRLWLNAVEGFFSVITRRRIRRGVFKSIAELEDAIRRYIRDHNGHPKPFVWTKSAKEIFGKLKRLPAPSD